MLANYKQATYVEISKEDLLIKHIYRYLHNFRDLKEINTKH